MCKVDHFFELFNNELESKIFNAVRMNNVYETGITVVQKPEKDLAERRSKVVSKILSAEMGETTTVISSMSASCVFVSAMFLFKRKNMKERLRKGALPGSPCMPSANGWMDCMLFLRYMEHFIQYTHPTENGFILLIFDGYHSHKSLEVVELAKANHITLLTIPPHPSHQLNVTNFGPLKAMYDSEVDK